MRGAPWHIRFYRNAVIRSESCGTQAEDNRPLLVKYGFFETSFRVFWRRVLQCIEAFPQVENDQKNTIGFLFSSSTYQSRVCVYRFDSIFTIEFPRPHGIRSTTTTSTDIFRLERNQSLALFVRVILEAINKSFWFRFTFFFPCLWYSTNFSKKPQCLTFYSILLSLLQNNNNNKIERNNQQNVVFE